MGIDRAPRADLLVPHVDLTHMPSDYAAFVDRYPAVLNRTVKDISKRRISDNLVRQDASWDGPVIVKTNLNCGGLTELRLKREEPTHTASPDPSSELLAQRSAVGRPVGRRTLPWHQVRAIPPR